jgi:hypothetical protein
MPEKLNIIYDGLSRLLTPSELGLDSSLEYNASDEASMLNVLQLCDPDAALLSGKVLSPECPKSM